MNAEQASVLTVGQKVQYWDGRIADVVEIRPEEEENVLKFDPTLESVSRVKYYDMRMAEIYTGTMTVGDITIHNAAVYKSLMSPMITLQPVMGTIRSESPISPIELPQPI